jgi:hypothetical protein
MSESNVGQFGSQILGFFDCFCFVSRGSEWHLHDQDSDAPTGRVLEWQFQVIERTVILF